MIGPRFQLVVAVNDWRSRKRRQMMAKRLHLCGEFGAGEEIRTLDPNLGKVVLYH